MAFAIKPLEDRIVIKTLAAEQKTASGLVIPDTAQEKPQEGSVIAVGPGRKLDNGKFEEMPIAPGAYIRFGTMNDDRGEEYLKYFPYEENGVKYLIMSWQDVCWQQDEPFEVENA